MINAPRSIIKKFQKNIAYLTKTETCDFCRGIADLRTPLLTLAPFLALSTESVVTKFCRIF